MIISLPTQRFFTKTILYGRSDNQTSPEASIEKLYIFYYWADVMELGTDK